MRALSLLVILGAVVPRQASAGGVSFACRVVGFEAENREEYVITLETDSVGNTMIVHARYREPWNWW
jgi:hypothetical protein